MKIFYFIICAVCLLASFLKATENPYVIGELSCELGNNLFQVATTCAHAWDHHAEPHFPDLENIQDNGMPLNYQHVFFRCSSQTPSAPVQYRWKLPVESNFCYMTIPYHPNMVVENGTYQSEQFFGHHRERLLDLFAPHPEDLSYIQDKYAHILAHPLTVGVQMRWFGRKNDEPWNTYLVQYGYDYFSQAIAVFPENTLFVVSTNNKEFARKNLPQSMKNVIFLNEPYYIDFFILSMCKHQIISNSSFGWWTAWLNRNPDKVVLRPKEWIDPNWHFLTPVKDVWPESWIQINAEWTKPSSEV